MEGGAADWSERFRTVYQLELIGTLHLSYPVYTSHHPEEGVHNMPEVYDDLSVPMSPFLGL